MYNCKPRPKPTGLVYWFESIFASREYLQAKYCANGHGLAYMPGYTPSNGGYECPECGLDDLNGLKVNYKLYPWYTFD